MRKKTLFLLLVLISFTFAVQSFTELLKQVEENIITNYAQPFINSFGNALNSGLYHSAASHKIGGFDIQLKAMYIPIPEVDKIFRCSIPGLYINPLTSQIETTWFSCNASTIFGPSKPDTIYLDQIAPTDTIAIPPILPGGTGLSFFSLIMLQMNVGLSYGLEVMVRYMPEFDMPMGRETKQKISFWGIGIKEDITCLPFPILNHLPINIAVQGVYQNFKLGKIINTTTMNANIVVSKSLILVTPYVGFGWEETTTHIQYSTQIQTFDTSMQIITITKNIDKTFVVDNQYRFVAGATINFGPILINGAYNYAKYSAISAGLGISIK